MSIPLQKIVSESKADIESLPLSFFTHHAIHADVLRLDKIHPVISGNKWFKLKYYLAKAIDENYSSLLSFGGAFSNHIAALAAAAEQLGLPVTGIIRGEESTLSSPTLREAAGRGMKLAYINREQYRQKEDPGFLDHLQNSFPGTLMIPEGGAGELGIRGCSEILEPVDLKNYSHIICALGTGTMYRGLARSIKQGVQLMGVVVLKGFENNEGTGPLIPGKETGGQNQVFYEYHFGGYAKKDPTLFRFMNEWYNETGIPTDFVYTAKMFYAFTDLARKKYFEPGSRILLIHSGGLQGNASLAAGTLNF